MNNTFYPSEEQLFSLYRFLTLLKNDKMFWHKIEPWGDTIKINVEPSKGDFDLKIFKISKDGEIQSDEFRDRL